LSPNSKSFRRCVAEQGLPPPKPALTAVVFPALLRSILTGANRRYTTTWFRATNSGKYHLFCAEYCGTKHSGMIGWVYAMEPYDYRQWLSGAPKGTLTEAGAKLFEDLAPSIWRGSDAVRVSNASRCRIDPAHAVSFACLPIPPWCLGVPARM
jgi:hypothetical protein